MSVPFSDAKMPKRILLLAGRADYICEVSSYGRWVVEVKRPSEDLSYYPGLEKI